MSSHERTVRQRVLGVPVDTLRQGEIIARVLRWTEEEAPRVAVGVNANVCNLAARDHRFLGHLEAADLAYADGQSIVWAARALGIGVPERVATTDLVFPLAAACAERGKNVFLYGSAPGVAEQSAERLRSLAPGLRTDCSDGFVPPERMDELIARIRAHGTHVLLVGLGDPLQQDWIATHRDALGVPVILSCGGLFDWTSGRNRRAPAWMISSGLEWLWRLAMEPRRLAKRYLIGNPQFLWRLGGAIVRQRFSRAG